MNNLALVFLTAIGFSLVVGGAIWLHVHYLKRALKPLMSLVQGEISISIFSVGAILIGEWRGKKVEIRATSNGADIGIRINLYHRFPFSCTILQDKNNRFVILLPPYGFLRTKNKVPEDKLDAFDFIYKDFFTKERREAIHFIFKKGFDYITISNTNLETKITSWWMIPLTGREKETLQIEPMSKILKTLDLFLN